MFNSIRNNFGAGTIAFKDVQESNFIVLNARFTCSPQSEAYRQAEVLEITVPALRIDRSTEAGVVVRFKYSEEYSGSVSVYDGGTVAKSWIKDAGTICIEKLDVFDDRDELIIYIQTLYCQLGQGSNFLKGRNLKISFLSADKCLTFSTTDTFCIVLDRWVLFHMRFDRCSSSVNYRDWEAFIENFPDDITADVPVITASNYEFPQLGGITESHIEESIWSLPYLERESGFTNTGNDVFSFAYLIRDREPEPQIPGRLLIREDPLTNYSGYKFENFDLELIPSPAVAACSGQTSLGEREYIDFSPKSCPAEMPVFEAFFLTTNPGSNGLSVLMQKMQLTKPTPQGSIRISCYSGERNLSFKLFDTAIAMAL